MDNLRAPALLLLALAPGAIWIEEEPPAPEEREVSYTNDIRPLVRTYCTTCHAGPAPEAGLDLSHYATLREETEEGELLARLRDAEDPMPPSGLLPEADRELFATWARTGFVEVGEEREGEPEPGPAWELPEITPHEVGEEGLAFLEQMQGHWVGSLELMGETLEWFAFDYRPIAPSHVHGIFEGGTMGNLFTSFFLADFRGTRTLMARNGGVLNGIYRTSYFVLDRLEEGTYRFVDALGGAEIMWMELRFEGEALDFRSYTSRFGLTGAPKKHMHFRGRRTHPELAAAAAKVVRFPRDVVHWELPHGLPSPDWGEYGAPTSASYLWEGEDESVEDMARLSGDPYRIDQVPHLASLEVEVKAEAFAEDRLLLYLSMEPLTDDAGALLQRGGYLRLELAAGLLQFPELVPGHRRFTFTYLHPGDYHLTVIADRDGDSYPGPGDACSASRKVRVEPESAGRVVVEALVEPD